MIEELSWKLECWWRSYKSCQLFGRKHDWTEWKTHAGYPAIYKVVGGYCTKCGRCEEGKFENGKFIGNKNGVV